jgi:hypothetical protein
LILGVGGMAPFGTAFEIVESIKMQIKMYFTLSPFHLIEIYPPSDYDKAASNSSRG